MLDSLIPRPSSVILFLYLLRKGLVTCIQNQSRGWGLIWVYDAIKRNVTYHLSGNTMIVSSTPAEVQAMSERDESKEKSIDELPFQQLSDNCFKVVGTAR